MDLKNISTEELYAEINRRNVAEALSLCKINIREIIDENNYDVFVLEEDFIKMMSNENKETAEYDITLYYEKIDTAQVDMKKLYFYSSFRGVILDNVSVDEMLCEVTNENKTIDLNDIELEYITIKLNNGKEAYLVL